MLEKLDKFINSFAKNTYSNLGKKFCRAAVISAIIGIALSALSPFILTVSFTFEWDDLLIPLMCIFGFGILLFINSFLFYAFGQKLDDIHALREKICDNDGDSNKEPTTL